MFFWVSHQTCYIRHVLKADFFNTTCLFIIRSTSFSLMVAFFSVLASTRILPSLFHMHVNRGSKWWQRRDQIDVLYLYSKFPSSSSFKFIVRYCIQFHYSSLSDLQGSDLQYFCVFLDKAPLFLRIWFLWWEHFVPSPWDGILKGVVVPWGKAAVAKYSPETCCLTSGSEKPPDNDRVTPSPRCSSDVLGPTSAFRRDGPTAWFFFIRHFSWRLLR